MHFRQQTSLRLLQSVQCLVSWLKPRLWGNMAVRRPGIERVQAVADISRSALCCHSNETRAPIAHPPNYAQLGGTPIIPPIYIRISAVVCECAEGQTDGRDRIHFASATPHGKCNKGKKRLHAPWRNAFRVHNICIP